MGRTKDCKTKKECWRFKVYYPDKGIIIIDKNYCSLRDIANETNLPYSKIVDLKDGGRNKTKNTISFYPTIELQKIGAIKQNEPDEPIEETPLE
tara:strand:+ start:16906 stop:17187 length:282 start_codon:yes stop_codon:yes gene_type:complete